MPSSLVGQVSDIISGQVNVFNGTDPGNLPQPETARTRTIGLVWTLEPGDLGLGGGAGSTAISIDYYDIDISDFIDEPTGQEALDLCYVQRIQSACDGVVRIGGTLSISGAGVPALFTNFNFFRAEGVQFGLDTNYDLANYGALSMSFNGNLYVTNKFQTTAASGTVDCKGRFGTSCDPVPEWRHTMRLSWFLNRIDASFLWRYVGGMDAQANEADALFPAFRQVGAESYFDITLGYQVTEFAQVNFLVTNIANTDPPILGSETGTTEFNSGNTFPSLYDVLGRTYSFDVRLSF